MIQIIIIIMAVVPLLIVAMMIGELIVDGSDR